MAAPYFRNFILKNESESFTVFPVVWDESGTKKIWDGSETPSNQVTKGSERNFDLNITGKVPDNTVVVLGCRIQDGDYLKDANSKRTYIKTSDAAAVGRVNKDKVFSVDPAKAASLDPAAFQAAYLKLNNPAVAKLLHTIANLISPEISAIA
ncbi:hypothetical protein JMJ35_001059 [Cladonia borealis]|uniref:Uncharacterized protein n=1 Tax=Cladonia borealis TaxID=184061 RepID=A0AA39RAA4_9LECA|nr:hypothetical protein JMJ35_001059 [Cladonia borealis]